MKDGVHGQPAGDETHAGPDMAEQDACCCDDVLEVLRVVSRGGVALPHDEAFAVALAIKTLASNKTLTRIRYTHLASRRPRRLPCRLVYFHPATL